MNLYLDLFLTFFKIGAFTFGGGYAMLPLVQQEVEKHAWMTQSEIVNFIAVSEATPGPFAVNISTYIGTETGGLAGAFCATLGVVLPSFIIILAIAKIYQKFEQSHTVQGVMSGLRPAVVGLIGASVLSVGSDVFLTKNAEGIIVPSALIFSIAVFALSIFLSIKKKIHPIKVIVLAALLGIIAGYAGILG